MSAADHEVVKVRRYGRVHHVVCACGQVFKSINSEGWARMYHTSHRLGER